MSGVEFARVRAVFDEVVHLPPDQISSRLDSLCRDMPGIGAEVLLLLQHVSANPASREGPATTDSAPAVAAPDRFVGKRIGQYTITRRIAAGGMGEVYEAEQEQPLRRRVAWKVIRAGMDSRVVVARFEHERQTLTRLEHPNIARILDAGTTPDGCPWFAMEFVAGEPITDYCDRHRLSIRARLEMFVSVCDAVQHAHARGIIHRDIKPSNVLVGEVTTADTSLSKPQPKVIDFGIAKALGDGPEDAPDHRITGLGTPIGTPCYMSPEQAAGTADIDIRTDVYSLGAVLYELLAGTPPFEKQLFVGAPLVEALRIVSETEPPRPSDRLSGRAAPARSILAIAGAAIVLPPDATIIASARSTQTASLTRELRSELDWIPMRALQKERERRYATPIELATDIRAYLDGRPLRARPDSKAYRVRKFIARHRVLVVGCLLLGTTLLAGIVGVVRAERRAQDEKATATAERDRARVLLSLAREAIENYTHRLSEDPRMRSRDLEDVRKQLLASAVDYYEGITGLYGSDPEVKEERGKAYGRLAEITADIGSKAEAVELLAKAHNVFAGLVEKYPGVPGYQRNLAVTCGKQGGELSRVGRPDHAEAAFRESIAIYVDLISKGDSPLRDRQSLAGNHANLGNFLRRSGRPDAAAKELSQARLIREALVAEQPDDKKLRRDLAAAHRDDAIAAVELGRVSEAEQGLVAARELEERLVADHADETTYRMGLEATLNDLAMLYTDLGRFAEAEQAYLDAAGIDEDLCAAHPRTLRYRANLATVLNNLGTMYADLARLDQAEPTLGRARDLRQALLAADPGDVTVQHDLAGTYNNLGRVHARQGRDAQATDAYEEARRIRDRLAQVAPPNPETLVERAILLNNQAMSFADAGQAEKAQTNWEEARQILLGAIKDVPDYPRYHMELAKVLTGLQGLAVDRHEWVEALELFGEDLAIREALVNDHPTVVEYQNFLASGRNNRGRMFYLMAEATDVTTASGPSEGRRLRAAAVSDYSAAVDISRTVVRTHPLMPKWRESLTGNLLNLGSLYGQMQQLDEAKVALHEALDEVESLRHDFDALPRLRRLTASIHNSLGVTYQRSEQIPLAEASYRRTVDLGEQLHAAFPMAIDYGASLGLAYSNMGDITRLSDPEASLEWYAKSIAMLAPIQAAHPSHRSTQDYLGKAHASRADYLQKLGRARDALADWDQAIAHSSTGMRNSLRVERLYSLLHAGPPSHAAADLAELSSSPDATANQVYDCARLYALASSRETDEQVAQQYSCRAIELLTKALDEGLKNPIDEVREHFASIGHRKDFEQLIHRFW